MEEKFTFYPDRFLDWKKDEDIKHLDEVYIAITVVLTLAILVGGILLL